MIAKNTFLVSLFSFCFLYIHTCDAQKQPPYIEHFTVNEGLISNSVSTAFRDSRGYLWIGTNDGLNRFNGIDFTGFLHDPDNPNSIEENYIRKIFEDEAGRIWLVTHNNRLCLYHPDSLGGKEFRTVARSEDDPHGPAFDRVAYVWEDAGRKVWVSEHGGRLIPFDQKENRFREGIFLRSGTDTLSTGLPLRFFDDQKRVYFFQESIGIYAADLHTGQVVIRTDSALSRFLRDQNVTSSFVQFIKTKNGSREHALWCVSEKGSLIAFQVESGKTSVVASVPGNKGEIFEGIGVDYQGKAWISGNKGGAWVYDPRTGHFENYLLPFRSAYDEMPAVILRYYLDHENIFWMVTRSGLYKMDPQLNQFENFSVRQPGINFRRILNVSSFYKLSSDTLLIGELNGIHIYRESTNELHFRPTIRNGQPLQVSEFFRDARGRTFLNTLGLQHLDIPNWRFPEFNYTGDTALTRRFMNSGFHSILIDTIDNLEAWWLPPWNADGLYLYFPSTGEIRNFTLKNPDGGNFSADNLRGIARDKKGNIWVGSMEQGVACITGREKFSYTVYRNVKGDSTSLPGNRIYDICTDLNGDVWFIIPVYGIAQLVYDANGLPRFRGYTTAEGLHNIYLYDAQVDRRNNIWISSDAGIDRFDVGKKKFTHYGRADGILNPQFATGCGQDDDGYFYFSSWQTFIRFKPDSLSDNRKPVLINVVQLKVMDRDSTRLLRSSRFSLPYDSNYLSIELETVSMTNARLNRIRYRLVGIDKDWNYDRAKARVQYSSLQPGNYIFEYNASNSDGMWNDRDRQFAFVIAPPFYRTGWFYTLVFLFFASMLYGFYKYRIALVRKEEKLRLSVMVKTQEEERRRMARDLHDDVGAQLSTVKLFISSLKKEKQTDEAERLKENSLDIINSSINDIREILISLSPKSLDEHGYVAATEELVNKINQSEMMKFNLNIHGIHGRLERNTEVGLFRITQELINNTIRHAGASEVWLEIILRDGKIHLLYEDNGIGYEPGKAKKGYGLKNIMTRTALLNGTVHQDTATGKGTRVMVEIPYNSRKMHNQTEKTI